MLTREELKTHAKAQLSGKWGLAVGGFFLANFVIPFMVQIILEIAQTFVAIIGSLPLIIIAGAVGIIISIIITCTLKVGLCKFALNYANANETPALENLFNGFKVVLKVIGLSILTSLCVMIGTLLLIVPGIILTFMFSQAFFILADDHNKSVMDCLKESSAMMKGYKFDYFVLQLSFIGWGLLCILSLGIGTLWLIPYITVTNASFYLKVRDDHYGVTENIIQEF